MPGFLLVRPAWASIDSLRHRAADKLRAVECPPNIRYELLSHTKTIAEGYGIGSPVTLLKKWIDLIDGI